MYGTTLPDIARIVHFVTAVAFGVLLYPDWADEGGTLTILRYGAFPLLTVTGLYLWVVRWRAMRRVRPPAPANPGG